MFEFLKVEEYEFEISLNLGERRNKYFGLLVFVFIFLKQGTILEIDHPFESKSRFNKRFYNYNIRV